MSDALAEERTRLDYGASLPRLAFVELWGSVPSLGYRLGYYSVAGLLSRVRWIFGAPLAPGLPITCQAHFDTSTGQSQVYQFGDLLHRKPTCRDVWGVEL